MKTAGIMAMHIVSLVKFGFGLEKLPQEVWQNIKRDSLKVEKELDFVRALQHRDSWELAMETAANYTDHLRWDTPDHCAQSREVIRALPCAPLTKDEPTKPRSYDCIRQALEFALTGYLKGDKIFTSSGEVKFYEDIIKEALVIHDKQRVA